MKRLKTRLKAAEGWAVLDVAKKAHYFRRGQAICSRKVYLGMNLETDAQFVGDRCAKCAQRLGVERVAKKVRQVERESRKP